MRCATSTGAARAATQQCLFTNEFEGERITDVGLFLDARPVLNLRTQAGELFEYGVNATASLGSALLRDGHHVSLLVYGYGYDARAAQHRARAAHAHSRRH